MSTSLATGQRTRTQGPRNPDEPITDPQRALMKRLGLRVRKEMTQGAAHTAISRYLEKHPEVAEQLAAERTARAQERWAALRDRYMGNSIARCRPIGKPVPSEGQIGGLMKRAFERPKNDVLRHDILGALEQGVSAAQASALMREADETPVIRPRAAPQQDPQEQVEEQREAA